jgi:hypothetical protein
VVAAVAAAGDAHSLAGGGREFPHHVRRDGLVPRAFQRALGAFGVGACLVANGFQARDAVLQGWVGKVYDA